MYIAASLVADKYKDRHTHLTTVTLAHAVHVPRVN